MATLIIPEDLRKAAAAHLNAANDEINCYSKRLRALAASILALLPAELMAHPALVVSLNVGKVKPSDQEVWALRDAIIATRELADLVDGIASVLGDAVPSHMLEARQVLKLTPPDRAIETQSNKTPKEVAVCQ